METSPPEISCPSTVTTRRNPHRRARPTPLNTTTTAAAANSPTSPSLSSKPLNISSFPLNDILSIDVAPPTTTTNTASAVDHATIAAPSIPNSDAASNSTSLKVFLRVRPLSVAPKKAATAAAVAKPGGKAARLPKMKKASARSCLVVNDSHSVTVTSPLCDSARSKSEVYTGFSHVFSPDSSQDEVYERMMRPIVEEFLNGRSGLLAALGPSGSGKTHTVFGSAKEPGLIPRALHHIFETDIGNKSMSSRSVYLSVFEIYSERGKGEKLSDLSPDGGDIFMQQSVVKGLKEVLIRGVAQAESVLALAKSKRATAMTNSNGQSSRSQCIINIRWAVDEAEMKNQSPLSGCGLTFVDLAGAEREKKTGNQGGRLLESNFINNTSMVFGLCLRSLLEHQKNPKKPLQKHFQSSLLTKYLRDYLEGRKRMALILTARSGPEDYFDASFLLRQASPFMEIKFHNLDGNINLPGNKRRNQMTCSDHQKRVKLCDVDDKDEMGRTSKDSTDFCEKDPPNKIKDDNMLEASESALAGVSNPEVKLKREYYVMQGFAKALWNVLKQYKERVKAMQSEIDLLTENIKIGHNQHMAMEKELHDLKSHCSCVKQDPLDIVCSIGDTDSAPACSVLEEHTDYGGVASEELQGLEFLEKPVIYSGEKQCLPYPDHKLVEIVALEEHPNVCPFKCKAASHLQEKDEHNHFVREICETSTSEAGCKRSNMEIRQHQDSEGNFGFCVQGGSEDLRDLGPPIGSMVHPEDSPSTTRTFAFVDEKNEPEAISRTPCRGAVLQCRGSETSVQQNEQVQCSPMKCEYSRDQVSKDDSHQKDPADKEDRILTAHCPKLHVVDPKVQRENNGEAAVEDDKENVTNVPQTSLNTDQESKELFHCKPSKENVTKVPQSSLNTDQEAKELSHCKPSKAEKPKRRLMPASSLLLRDAGSLDIADDSVKHRGGRGGQRLAEVEHKRTRGNASLLRLLKNNLPL